MNKEILIIRKNPSFMVDAIMNNLVEAEFKTEQCETTIKDFTKKMDDFDIYLIYLGDNVSEIRDMLVFMKDVVIEKEKYLNVIGDKKDIDDLFNIMPEAMFSKVMYRPLNLKSLVEYMEKEVEGIQSEQRKKHLLLVDDDIAYLKTIKKWLGDIYHVSIVSSGMQAITFIAKNKPDLILLDYEMPVTNGPQVLEMIRSELDTSEIPVIFLTGKGDKESVKNVIGLKPDGYILKNTERKKIIELLDDFFEQRKAKSY
ncbi:MAG: response regulator [Lachnospiraceae bacterium]|nr:response regulator [Lachnospiraceae bacterium]